jgi:hypothetical protein
MMIMKWYITGALMLGLLATSAVHGDDELYGTWKPVEYQMGENSMPLRGVMIITPGYFVGNTTFDVEGDGILEANANSGPITVENGKIVLMQWMQLHWRPNEPEADFSNPENPQGTFLRTDIPEVIEYTVEGDQLVFHFPSGNKYISKRLED